MDGHRGQGADYDDHAQRQTAVANPIAAIMRQMQFKPDPRQAAFSADVMALIYMDEQSILLRQMRDMMRLQIPDGTVSSRTLVVTDQPQILRETGYMSVALVNDDSSRFNVCIMGENRKPTPTDGYIKPGGALPIDFGAKVGKEIWLCCYTGETATVRTWGIR